jgi:multisubunit Na+/H+ antiporter MnhG subunit
MARTLKKQQHIDLLLMCFLVLLVVTLVPLTVIYILAILRGGQNVEGINQHCGSAFHGFVVTNCVFNWFFFIVMITALAFMWIAERRNIDGMEQDTLSDQSENIYAVAFLLIGSIYSVLAVVSLAIVPDSMSRKACSDAIANVSWGSPLLGVVGYLNLAIDLLVALFCFLTFSVAYNFISKWEPNHFDHKRDQKPKEQEHDYMHESMQQLNKIREALTPTTNYFQLPSAPPAPPAPPAHAAPAALEKSFFEKMKVNTFESLFPPQPTTVFHISTPPADASPPKKRNKLLGGKVIKKAKK